MRIKDYADSLGVSSHLSINAYALQNIKKG